LPDPQSRFPALFGDLPTVNCVVLRRPSGQIAQIQLTGQIFQPSPGNLAEITLLDVIKAPWLLENREEELSAADTDLQQAD